MAREGPLVAAGDAPLALWDMARHHDGSRQLQNYMDTATSSEIQRLSVAMTGDVRRWTMAPYASYVVEKFIYILKQADFQFVIDELLDIDNNGVLDVAKNSNGSRVLERLFELGREEQVDPIVGSLSPHAAELSIHRYGNYVLQSVFEHGTPHQARLLTCGYVAGARSWLPRGLRDLDFGRSRFWIVPSLFHAATKDQKLLLCVLLLESYKCYSVSGQSFHIFASLLCVVAQYCDQELVSILLRPEFFGKEICCRSRCPPKVMPLCLGSGCFDAADFCSLLRSAYE